LPLLTYQDVDGAPELAPSHPAYYLLNQRPNPAMSRTHLLQKIVFDVWQHGDFFAQLVFSQGNHKLLGVYPIDPQYIANIRLEDDWSRTYFVRTISDGITPMPGSEILHIHYVSRSGALGNGVRGSPMWLECAESLGLSRQIIESAIAYYQHAVIPSLVASFAGKMNPQTRGETSEDLSQNFGGPRNRGKVPVMDMGGKLEALSLGSARESDLVKSIAQQTGQASQITGVSPIQLGDYSSAHYSTLSADNTQFYQASVSPLLELIEQEVNYQVFGKDSDFFCKFDTDQLLAGDRVTQAEINAMEIQAGYRLRSEAREEVGLSYLPAMDAVTMPINMGGNPDLSVNKEDVNQQVDKTNDDQQQSTTDPKNKGDIPDDK
jgi:HK97 family phage portal protein